MCRRAVSNFIPWASVLLIINLLGVVFNVYCKNSSVEQWANITCLNLWWWRKGTQGAMLNHVIIIFIQLNFTVMFVKIHLISPIDQELADSILPLFLVFCLSVRPSVDAIGMHCVKFGSMARQQVSISHMTGLLFLDFMFSAVQYCRFVTLATAVYCCKTKIYTAPSASNHQDHTTASTLVSGLSFSASLMKQTPLSLCKRAVWCKDITLCPLQD